MEKKMIITLEDLVVEFAANYSLGMKAVRAAAETYVTALRKYPKSAEAKFRERFPEITPDTWITFQDIGSGRLPPQTILMHPGAVDKLRKAKIPRKSLGSMVNQKVQLVMPSTGRPVDVPFTYLTESQADQMLNPITHKLRTIEQQKRYLKLVAEGRKHVSVQNRPWNIHGGKLVVHRAYTFSFSELEEIVGIIKGSGR